MSIRKIDAHMHTLYQAPERLFQVADKYGFEKFNVLACPCLWKYSNNLDCILPKAMDGKRAYAFGGLTYFEGQKNREALTAQLQRMMDAGFDGLKLIETKPDTFRRLGVAIDSDIYEGVFSLAEKKGFPILWHVGDPATCWNIETAPAFAVENGWCYLDDSFASLSEIYRQVETVLHRHPKLKVCLAHFYFTSDDMPHAARMFDTWENVSFDLTPGTEMYGHFLSDPEVWRSFFTKYQDRIIFGTDFTDSVEDWENGLFDHLYNLATKSIEESGHVKVWDIEGTGLGLDKEVLDKVYVTNFEGFAGEKPVPIHKEGLQALSDWCQGVNDIAGTEEDKEYAARLTKRILDLL